ncbi:hypothetical protein LBMAG42_09340 [Deltaproteobacteria bacterium]|nr:hypothetical protein LBMAG42_09340 [Deltaproteobacteria bacterium]
MTDVRHQLTDVRHLFREQSAFGRWHAAGNERVLHTLEYPVQDQTTFCLPDVYTFNPWFDLYFGATFCADCFEGTLPRIDILPHEERGNALAIAARGWMVLGRPADAMRFWERARALGGAEVEALGLFVQSDGANRAELRAAGLRSPGLRADGWCDAAALHLVAGSLDAAVRAVGRALTACPDHGEALHWQRFLSLPDAVAVAQRVDAGRPSRRGRGLAVQDALALLPTRHNGWVSEERLHRRAQMDELTEGPAGSALARFDHAGVREYFLAADSDWATVPASHPLARAELEIDTLRALVKEKRPALAAARSVWDSALASGDALRVDDVGQLLCALATQDVTLVGVGREAADRLIEMTGEGPPLFRAYRALFAAMLAEPGAVQRAREVLDGTFEDDLSWRLSVGALFRAGAVPEAEAEVRRALADPMRRSIATYMGSKSARTTTPVVSCSPRTGGRELGSAAHPEGLA